MGRWSEMGLGMDPAVIWVCVFNGLIFLVLMRGIPILWGLSKALAATAKTVNGWSEATQASLGSAPQGLEQLRSSLKTSRASLGKRGKWLKWIAGVTSLGRRILGRLT